MKNVVFRHLFVACLLLACVFAPVVKAAEVTGLYQATVPVESRDDERQRVRAFAAAMREMLVKVTGHEDIREQPAIQSALSAPQSYVESWAYRTQTDATTGQQQLMIEVSFYQAEISSLLESSGIAVWPQNRPETLVWMIIQDEQGERFQVDPNAGTGEEEMQLLQDAAKLRGLPVLGPLWDFEDQRIMRPEFLWALDETTLRMASARYQYESILAIRILKSVTGQIVGKAVHVFRDRVQETEVLDGSLNDFIAAATSMVAKELADNYAVRVSSTTSSSAAQLMLLSVEGVGGLNDYANVLHYLESVAGISDVQVREVADGTLTFSLNASGQVRQLVENLAIDRKLQALSDPAMEGNYFRLRYRWQAL
ncbi:MAG: DUF2066 domain-containing protein [Pseudomonadota bacterium]